MRAWIKAGKGLHERLEVAAITRKLGIVDAVRPVVDALSGGGGYAAIDLATDIVVSRLLRLWFWFDDHVPAETSPFLTRDKIDYIANLPGLADALIGCGWLIDNHDVDSTVTITGFDEHFGSGARMRAKHAALQSTYRARQRDESKGVTSRSDRKASLRTEQTKTTTRSKTKARASHVVVEGQKPEDRALQDDALATPPWVPMDALTAYREMRVKMRRPLTTRAEELVIAKLDELRAQGHDPRQVLEQSILNGWQGIFEVKTPARAAPQGAVDYASIDYRSGATREEDISWLNDGDEKAAT